MKPKDVLQPCPFCGKEPAIDNNFAICVNDDCELSDYWSGLEDDSWNTRPIEDALAARIAELEGIIKSDDERLTEAGLKVNLYFGCDTAEIMAEEILSSRARIAELESQVNQLIEAGFDLSSYVPFEFPEVQRFYRVMKECKPEVK